MLLSSPAFSGFLNDLSVNGMTAPSVAAPERPASQAAPVQRNTRKDVNPNRVQQDYQNHSSAQIGMALIPEPVMDFSMLDSANTGNWSTGIDMSFPQVFAVTEVPTGPTVDTSILSGKASIFVDLRSASDESKEAPAMLRLTEQEEHEPSFAVSDPEVEFDESNPAFALFVEASAPLETEATESSESLFGGIEPEKVFERFELVVDDGTADVAVSAELDRLSSSIAGAFQRIANLTSHL